MSLIALALETTLSSYVRALMPGFEVYPGHTAAKMDKCPRAIVTAISSGGPLVEGAGVEEIDVEILIVVSALPDPAGDPDPVVTLSSITDAVRSALSLDMLPTVKAAISGLDGLEFVKSGEGRDKEHAQHGILLNYTAWAHAI